ncbi:hypothetical protein LCD36_04625 [Saccharopolyspora sp. 6T]|uniref:hypothetical protein n=1 Tax=Saccharopolyspora sp. 6T TaxID=2877238 RepID=UPI001CD4EF58|nr:hypothetical protein [Saccharopolyspora sp. 6T]MCA1185737.1 hypothetical protein [Saccharopolyspora sp. 6T]
MSNIELHEGMEIETELVPGRELEVGDHVITDDLIYQVVSSKPAARRGFPVWSQETGQAVGGREVEVPYAPDYDRPRYRVITVVR